MRRLPPLAAGNWSLPFADRSAVALVDDLLDLSGPAGLARSTDSLPLDAPLMVWAACRAWLDEGFRPRSRRQLAGWLRLHAARVLQWQATEAKRFNDPFSDAQSKARAERVATDLIVAELAAALGAAGGEDAAEEARLLGTLHAAEAWLELASPGVDCSEILPEWLLQSAPTPAGQHVAQATRMLEACEIPESANLDIQARRDWASQNANQWLAEIAGVPPLLPALTAKLGRLAALEHRFSETLETEKLESLAELAAGAGHEINNPLAIIGGRSQLLLRDEQSPERQRELALIVAQVRRANEMIADMRLFSRPPEPECQSFDLTDLVDQIAAEFADPAAERAIELVRSGEIAPIMIEADPIQIGVVLHALVRNALEAVGREGVVEISMRRSPTGVEVTVADDGPGVLPEERRHLFDPFYSARQAGRGLGFGLSKAWRIVTNHGGKIEVDSEPGEGASFVVKLLRRIPERS